MTENLHNRISGWGGLAIACAMNVKGKHMHIYFPAPLEVLL